MDPLIESECVEELGKLSPVELLKLIGLVKAGTAPPDISQPKMEVTGASEQ